MSDPERGTTVGHEKKVGATNHVVEIVMMTTIGKEAVKERGIVIVTEIATENETERENIVIVKEGEHLFFMFLNFTVTDLLKVTTLGLGLFTPSMSAFKWSCSMY